ncbi:MAG: glucosaminidase domain-containing protein [Hespellia sp.]|nr:glucosaminidase domain-containing protein [Hespellia sp.]
MKKIEKLLKTSALCILMITAVLRIQTGLTVEEAKNEPAESVTCREKEKKDPLPVQQEAKPEETEAANSVDVSAENVSVENGYTIMGENGVNLQQMVAFFQASGHTYPSEPLGVGGAATIEDYCQMFLEEAAAEGVRAEIPYVQSMKETGWLQFEGVCEVSQYNFAGLGATGGDVAGESYPDVRTGIRAQIQHLKAYATADPLQGSCVDTRYELVRKASAPYVQWLGQQENPEGCGWATDSGYGISIAEMIQNLKTF